MHAKSQTRERFDLRAILSFNSKILADLAIRGRAISFLTLAFVAISILLGRFFRKMD